MYTKIYIFYYLLVPRTYPIASGSKFHADSRPGYAKPSHMSPKIKFSVFPICHSNAIHHFPSNLNPSPSKTPPKR